MKRADRIAFVVVTFINVVGVCGLVWALGIKVGGLLGAAVCWVVCDAGSEILRDARSIMGASTEEESTCQKTQRLKT